MRRRSDVPAAVAAEDPGVADPFEDAGGRADPEPPPGPATGSRDPVKWPTANKAREVPMRPGFEAMVDLTFVDDPLPIYEALENDLVVGDQRDDRGTLLRALDMAEANARLAFKLWRTAQLEVKQWELDNQVINGAMRLEAQRALEAEKKNGLRTKMVTEADVDAMVSTLYPDEHRAQQVRRIKVHSMERNTENLVEMWNSKCRSLQAAVGKQR